MERILEQKIEPSEKLMLNVCYNFLDGINLPEEIKKEKRHFILIKKEKEAIEFCNLFEQRFNKKLIYQIKRNNCYFAYQD